MPGTAHDDDMPGRLVGEAGVVRDAFEQLPILLAALDGPDHRLAAMNAAYRSFTGQPDALGVPYRDAFPGPAGQPLHDMLDRVYATGQPESGTEWRAQIGLAPKTPKAPKNPKGPRGQAKRPKSPEDPGRPGGRLRRLHGAAAAAGDGTVNGLLVIATDVTARVLERRVMDSGPPGSRPPTPSAATWRPGGWWPNSRKRCCPSPCRSCRGSGSRPGTCWPGRSGGRR